MCSSFTAASSFLTSVDISPCPELKTPDQMACYQNWMAQQKADLEELQQALLRDSHDEDKLRSLVAKTLEHFSGYAAQRVQLFEEDAPSFFSPSWCTSYENSFMWLGGCRPSLFIRLTYTLSGSQLQAQLDEYLSGVRRGNLAELSAEQLRMVNDLQRRTITEEDQLSGRLARLHEDVAEVLPLLSTTFAANTTTVEGAPGSSSSSSSLVDQVIDCAMDAHVCTIRKILEEADNLRLNTVTKLMDIFTPRQAIDFLVAAKQLQFRINEWGKRRSSRKWKDPLCVIQEY